MASVAEIRPISQVHWQPRDQTKSGSEMMGRRYEALSRLSRSLTAGKLEDWVRDLISDLRGLLRFDFLDVILHEKDGNRVHCRSLATRRCPVKHIP